MAKDQVVGRQMQRPFNLLSSANEFHFVDLGTLSFNSPNWTVASTLAMRVLSIAIFTVYQEQVHIFGKREGVSIP